MSEQAGSVALIVHPLMISSTHRKTAHSPKPCQAKSSPLTPNEINHFH